MSDRSTMGTQSQAIDVALESAYTLLISEEFGLVPRTMSVTAGKGTALGDQWVPPGRLLRELLEHS